MIRNLKLLSSKLKLINQKNLVSPLNLFCIRTFVDLSSFKSNLNAINQLTKKNQIYQTTSDRRYSTNLTENQYEKLVEETLESLNDYFDELLERQTKLTNYDLSLSVSIDLVFFETNNFKILDFNLNFLIKFKLVFVYKLIKFNFFLFI